MLSRIYLLLKEQAGAKFITLIVFLVIAVSSFSVLSFMVISANFNRHMEKRFASDIPADEIIVRHGKGSGFFIFSAGSSRELDAAGLRSISSIKGVRSVEPVIALSVPSSASISFFTLRFSTDLVIAGASSALVRDALKSGEMRSAWASGKHARGIPVLIPGTLLDSYNSGLAAANRLPQILPDRLAGLTIGLRIGESSMSSLPGARRVDAVIAGYTDRVNVAGLVIPAAAVNELNRSFNVKGRYMFAVVKAADHASAEEVKKRIVKMGYTVDERGSISAEIVKIRDGVNYFTGFMVIFISILAGVSAGLCSMTALWGRLEYYRILRMLGASRFFIVFTVLVKASLTGGLAALTGYGALIYFGGYAASLIAIPGADISFEPEDLKIYSVIAAGFIIPAAASVPAVIRLFTAKLNIN